MGMGHMLLLLREREGQVLHAAYGESDLVERPPSWRQVTVLPQQTIPMFSPMRPDF